MEKHMTASQSDDIVTAALIIIGDEILSGRTKDKNIGYIAEYLTGIGVDLSEVRVVPDVEDRIVEAVNALRKTYTYVFTTGGIGPTHDDITADSIAKAFGVGIDHDPRAVAILNARYSDDQLNEARMRMARIPDGADLVVNPVSGAPGFRIENVFVMAGIPSIMQAMLDNIAPVLKTGRKILSQTIEVRIAEGRLAKRLGEIEKAHDGVMIGSYPFMDEQGYGTRLMVRSREEADLQKAADEVRALVRDLKPDM